LKGISGAGSFLAGNNYDIFICYAALVPVGYLTGKNLFYLFQCQVGNGL
jgi:hypothetical protein